MVTIVKRVLSVYVRSEEELRGRLLKLQSKDASKALTHFPG
jgi:hypothetical protein